MEDLERVPHFSFGLAEVKLWVVTIKVKKGNQTQNVHIGLLKIIVVLWTNSFGHGTSVPSFLSAAQVENCHFRIRV